MAFAGLGALLLASCTDMEDIPKHLRPLDSATRELIETKGMEETAPILVRIFKEESVLEVWKKKQASGRFELLKTYEICEWSGELGPKRKEGDRQAPEGFYAITPAQLNPKSSYHLSFNIGYPNAYDQSLGRTGTHLMVHGACSSRGCYSMTDEQIQEIYTLARLAFQGGQRSFQVQALPFRMTPANMAKYRKNENMPFWRMLKTGYDHFELTGQEPKVDVCSSQYVFDSTPEGGMSFSPTADCPPMSVPEPLRIAAAEKAKRDEAQMMVVAARLEAEEAKKQNAPAAALPESMLAKAPMAPSATPAAVPSGEISTASITPAPVKTVVAAAPAVAPAASPQVASAYTAPAAQQPNQRSGVMGFFTKLFD
jgi:murein L,D-transpeptidase YafK